MTKPDVKYDALLLLSPSVSIRPKGLYVNVMCISFQMSRVDGGSGTQPMALSLSRAIGDGCESLPWWWG